MSQGTYSPKERPSALPEDVWDAMNCEPDIVLQLTDGTLPAHSQLLTIWSVPLGTAVDALPAPAVGLGERVLPIDATVSDWCVVASMLYPVAEPASISWENVEAVAVLADKYNIFSLLQRAATFLEANVGSMGAHSSSSSSTAQATYCRCANGFCFAAAGERCPYCGHTRGSPPAPTCEDKDIWKWLQLSDRFGMGRITVACIGRIVSTYRNTATPQKVARLSNAAKDLLLVEVLSPGQTTKWKEMLPTDLKQQRLSIITEGLDAST